MTAPVADALAAARAGHVARLREAHPGWRVWYAIGQYHAMRRGSFLEGRRPGDPLHSLHTADWHELGAHLAAAERADRAGQM